MSLSLPIQPGKQLSILLSPEDGCIYFENLCGAVPVYFQAFINPEQHMLIIRRCTMKRRNAGIAEPTEDGGLFRVTTNLPFLELLYDNTGLQAKATCRIHGVERMLGESQLFLFDLNKTESCSLTGGRDNRGRMIVNE